MSEADAAMWKHLYTSSSPGYQPMWVDNYGQPVKIPTWTRCWNGWNCFFALEEQEKTAAAIDATIPAEVGVLKERILVSHRASNSVGHIAYSHPTSRGMSVLSVPPARSFAAKLSRSKAVFLVWPAWTPGKGLPFRKWQRDAPHGLGAFWKAISRPSIVNVVRTAVQSSAAVLGGIVGSREIEMLLDCGSTVSLIQERITTILPATAAPSLYQSQLQAKLAKVHYYDLHHINSYLIYLLILFTYCLQYPLHSFISVDHNSYLCRIFWAPTLYFRTSMWVP